LRHRDIEQYQIGFMESYEFQGFGTVSGFSDNFDVFSLIEKRTNPRPYQGVIIGKQNTDRFRIHQ
jgi:hypothetical protein